MNARDGQRCGLPANTTSAGLSPGCSVATTFIGTRSATLTLSETWLTTHASAYVRARTETGCSPQGTDPIATRPCAVTAKTSSRSSAVLTASSLDASGVRSSGLTCGLSQLTKDCPGAAAPPNNAPTSAVTRRTFIASPPQHILFGAEPRGGAFTPNHAEA